MTRIIRVWLVAVTVLLTMACTKPDIVHPGAPTPTPAPTPDGTLSQLKLEASASRLMAIDACVRAWADPGWEYRPYDLIGSFYEAHWCSGGVGGPSCSGPRPADYHARDSAQNFVRVSTFVFGNRFPEAHGFQVTGLYLPARSGWGAQFRYVSDGRDLTADGVQLSFWLFDQPGGTATHYLEVGSSYEYSVFETRVHIADTRPQDEIVATYLESAEALRDLGLGKIAELRVSVESTVKSHQALTCDFGTPPGGGLPPPCLPRSLTSAEEATALAEANAYFNTQQQLLTNQYGAMYAALLKAFPFQRCWTN